MAEKASRRKAKANGRAKAGHNSKADAPPELIEKWWAKVAAAQAAIEKAAKPLQARKGELRALLKAIEADGLDPAALKEAIAMDKDDHLEVVSRFVATGAYLRAHNSPLGTQLNLFSVDNIPTTMQAAVAGKRAGLRGSSIDENPYTPGSEPFAIYREHWDKGQAELHDQLR